LTGLSQYTSRRITNLAGRSGGKGLLEGRSRDLAGAGQEQRSLWPDQGRMAGIALIQLRHYSFSVHRSDSGISMHPCLQDAEQQQYL